jgi:hypothetical protein
MGMIDSFPYCSYHNPSYCDRCADDGFAETPNWLAAWDRAAAVFADTGDEVAAALAFRGRPSRVSEQAPSAGTDTPSRS